MKEIEVSAASNPLSDYANELDEGMIVLTLNKKSIAALVSLHNVDRESLALSTNPEFMEIIETAGEEVRRMGKASAYQGNSRFDYSQGVLNSRLLGRMHEAKRVSINSYVKKRSRK